MADDTLPIVFRRKRLTGLLPLGFGILATVAGVAMITDESFSYSSRHVGPFTLSPETTGWLLLAIGLPFAVYALLALVRRCPTIAVDETGIALARCFGGSVSVPWSRFKRVMVRHRRASDRGRTTDINFVFVVTDDGKEISFGIFDEADAIAAAIGRVAARMKAIAAGNDEK